MSLSTVISKIDRFLISCGFTKPQRNNQGYYMITMEQVKLYIHPLNDGGLISVIPSGRKYNIPETKHIEVEGIGVLEIMVNSQLSNPRMSISVPEDQLTIDRLNHITSFLMSRVDDIYLKLE